MALTAKHTDVLSILDNHPLGNNWLSCQLRARLLNECIMSWKSKTKSKVTGAALQRG
jgi:hypothetical protein